MLPAALLANPAHLQLKGLPALLMHLVQPAGNDQNKRKTELIYVDIIGRSAMMKMPKGLPALLMHLVQPAGTDQTKRKDRKSIC
jgi:hypothetical protein